MRPFPFPLRVLATFPLLLLATTAFASPEETTRRLNCEHVDPREPAVEATLIRQLGGGVVRRTGPHVLLIQAGGREVRIEDKPPHDEPFAGVHHWFCDRRGGFVLLRTTDETAFTGTLVNEATGAVTPAGEDVVFSEDWRAYFAEVQPDGLDGLEWKIYGVKGDLSWTGYNLMLDPKHPDRSVATLDEPRWKSTGEFVAQATCVTADEKKWAVTLRKTRGKWDWSPHADCPAERVAP